MKRLSTFLLILATSVMALTQAGCSGKTVDESDPAAMYKDAEEDIENDHYTIAIDKLRAVRNKFPYSRYAVDAQLKLADVYFLQESWAEAAAAYESFRDLHPKHEKVPYAMFRLAKSHFNDIPSPHARDMTPAYKAQDAYNDFLRRFPKAPEAEEGRNDIATVRNALADKELYVGEFYYKRDFPDAARPRYEKIVALYPDTGAAKQAQDRLAKLPPPSPRKTAPEGAEAR